jgi:gliding motility-associated-like protein
VFLEIAETDLPCFNGLYIPNVFSPNADGINDEFRPFINALFTSYHLAIFDRWGEMIYESKAYGESWDGSFRNKPLQQGVFVYRLSFRLGSGELKQYKGGITLVR